MTKINKLGKSTFVIAILALLLVAVLAFGGTYAYFSAQSSVIAGTVQTGHLRITKIENGTGNSELVSTAKIAQPNQTLYNAAKIDTTVNSNISYYTRVRFTATVTPAEGHKHYTDDGTEGASAEACGDYVANALSILNITIADGGASGSSSKWERSDTETTFDGSELYYYQLAPTVVDNSTTAQPAADKTESFTFTISVYNWVGDNGKTDASAAAGCEYWMDATITVSIVVEVLQADYLVDGTTTATTFANGAAAHTAWNTALGVQKSGS